MKTKLEIKRELFSLCKDYVDDKIQNAEEAIESAQSSANEETKSSSGDQYETSRSMIQLEIEKYSEQLNDGLKLKKALSQISIEKTYQTVLPGSLVSTNNGNFFIAISAGKLIIDKSEYIAISLSSPIGQSLYNKAVSDEITFRDKVYLIKSIN
ncbi:MAG: 3-oxoacyl-ACP synthase [Ignavibacteriales bacterium]|nr:3-oxoacyl-ACP synthase [Ignavibacteriales bacterium]